MTTLGRADWLIIGLPTGATAVAIPDGPAESSDPGDFAFVIPFGTALVGGGANGETTASTNNFNGGGDIIFSGPAHEGLTITLSNTTGGLDDGSYFIDTVVDPDNVQLLDEEGGSPVSFNNSDLAVDYVVFDANPRAMVIDAPGATAADSVMELSSRMVGQTMFYAPLLRLVGSFGPGAKGYAPIVFEATTPDPFLLIFLSNAGLGGTSANPLVGYSPRLSDFVKDVNGFRRFRYICEDVAEGIRLRIDLWDGSVWRLVGEVIDDGWMGTTITPTQEGTWGMFFAQQDFDVTNKLEYDRIDIDKDAGVPVVSRILSSTYLESFELASWQDTLRRVVSFTAPNLLPPPESFVVDGTPGVGVNSRPSSAGLGSLQFDFTGSRDLVAVALPVVDGVEKQVTVWLRKLDAGVTTGMLYQVDLKNTGLFGASFIRGQLRTGAVASDPYTSVRMQLVAPGGPGGGGTARVVDVSDAVLPVSGNLIQSATADFKPGMAGLSVNITGTGGGADDGVRTILVVNSSTELVASGAVWSAGGSGVSITIDAPADERPVNDVSGVLYPPVAGDPVGLDNWQPADWIGLRLRATINAITNRLELLWQYNVTGDPVKWRDIYNADDAVVGGNVRDIQGYAQLTLSRVAGSTGSRILVDDFEVEKL